MYSKTVKSTVSAALLIAASTAPSFSATAQDAEETYIYASYFTCPGGNPSDVDKVVKDEIAPIYNAGVKDGTIKNWGWSIHHTGGKWQRIFSHTNSSIDALLKSADTLFERGEAANVDPDNKFGKICNAHDDYIWEVKAGEIGDIEGTAALSTYFQCDLSQEGRTDEIMEEFFAPIYEANMGKGKLTSWTWAAHVYGGKYRRAIFTSAENFTDLTKTMDAIFDASYGGSDSQGMEFSKICSSHSDYLWYRADMTPE